VKNLDYKDRPDITEFPGHILSRLHAAVKDVQILLSMEDCALGMEQRSRYVALKDAQINPNEEECARDMVQRSNDAALQGAQIKFKREECVLSMGQKYNTNDAAARGAEI